MSKKLLLVFAAALVLVVLALRFIIGGPEDDWICESGGWIRHGDPSAPAPEGTCPNP